MNYTIALHNTDKFIGGVLNYPVGHNYQLLYKNFLKVDIPNILEIGTGHGGFAKFLKENNLKSFIVGADISPESYHNHVADHTNYNFMYDDFYTGNAFTELFLNWIKSKNYKFDFVVEDGPHDPDTQSFMLKNFYNFLKPNGVYVCEDVVDYNTAKKIIKSIPTEYKKYSYIWEATDSINRTDDICIVVDLR